MPLQGGASRRRRLVTSGPIDELLVLVASAPGLQCDLCAGWSEILGASDASPQGFGGTAAKVGGKRSRELGALSEERGDYIVLDGVDCVSVGLADADFQVDDDDEADQWDVVQTKHR